MSTAAWVDAFYRGFCETLPPEVRPEAERLAMTLGLAPHAAVAWSDVFAHEVTLGAPALVAEAMPSLPERTVRDALLAHMLAVVEAFGTDRIEDGQCASTAALRSVLEHARRARDAALERVGGASGELSYAEAEQRTLAAIRAERDALASPVGFALYEAIAREKQALGLPASVALARAAGWDERGQRCVARLLEHVAVGLQMYDDVIDWEDDLARGGAWAVALARGERLRRKERETLRPAARHNVLAAGVLEEMLRRAHRCFRAARRLARVLGMARLAAWAEEREVAMHELARREADAAGFAVRARALSAWAREVLA